MTYYNNVCLILAKLSSTRLKNKNILKLGKKSLLENSIKKAINSKIFDKIIISSESSKILKKISYFEKIDKFKRLKKLAKDPYTISDNALNIIKSYKKKKIFFKKLSILIPTSPFFLISDIRYSMKQFDIKKHECLMSVSQTDFPIFNGYLIKNKKLVYCFNKSKFKNKKSTECPLTFKSNGGITILNPKILEEKKNIHNMNKIAYKSSNWSFIDIDNIIDYKMSKIIFSKYFFMDEKNFYV